MYIEIGASAKPEFKHFLEEGHEVLFIEAHPFSFCQLVENLGHHKNAQFMLAAVSDSARIARFSRFSENIRKTSQSLSLESSMRYKKMPTVITPQERGDATFYIPTLTLYDLFEEFSQIDRIRLDVEGEEVPIFMEYDFRVKPQTIDIEFHKDEPAMHKIVSRMKEYGYSMIEKEKGGLGEIEITFEVIGRLC